MRSEPKPEQTEAVIISINAERLRRGIRPRGFCGECGDQLQEIAQSLTLEPDDYPTILDRLCTLYEYECPIGRR